MSTLAKSRWDGQALRVIVEGIGLHHGKEVKLELVREAGPVQFEREGVVRSLEAFHVSGTRFATSIACDAFELHTVEHFLAALAGLGVRRGCLLRVSGGAELPLLDGGAREYASWVAKLGLPAERSALRIARAVRIEVDGSIYELEPGDETSMSVEVELPASCDREASWDGDRDTFIDEIAPARTFAIESEVAELTKLGMARHVEARSVLVVSEAAIFGEAPIARHEPARHKLLDLIGDAYLHHGPPRGVMRVLRPGHAHNHAAFARALGMGALTMERM
jgi:UDP-3-O-[3-hydroxymyristoyl] N-acetylglucosamine deacetylase